MRLVSVCLLVFGLGLSVVGAQEPAKAPDDLAALKKELAQLKAQLAQAQAKPPLSPEARLEQTRLAFREIFARAKAQAGPGCKAEGGKLRVEIDPKGQPTLICEFRE